MLVAALSLIALSFQTFPSTTDVDFSGLPVLSASNVRTVSHSVTIIVEETEFDVSSTTVYKNTTGEEMDVTIAIPRGRAGNSKVGFPAITASWDKNPIELRAAAPATGMRRARGGFNMFSPMEAKVKIMPNATHALRISYKMPTGRTGYEQKQRIVPYYFSDAGMIETMNISYKYGGKTVFRIADPTPNWGWQVGTKGAYIRKVNYDPNGEMSFISFYPGGFAPIGD